MDKNNEESENEKVEKEGSVLTEEDLNYVNECRERFNAICDKFPPNFGKALSRRERDHKELNSAHLVYSEVSFDALAVAMMKIVKKYGKISKHGALPTSGAVFYDLGSGIGKALIAAGLVFNFASCHGIEILESLHRAAVWVQESFSAQAADLTTVCGRLPAMEVREGDFLIAQKGDWRRADCLFINASCYGDDMRKEIMKMSMGLKKGAFVISVSYAIPSPEFELCEYSEFDMNWGAANVFIQQKTTDAHEYVEPVAEEQEDESAEEHLVMDVAAAEMAKSTINGLFNPSKIVPVI